VLAVHNVWVGHALKPLDAEFETVARILHATEWNSRVDGSVGINPGRTGFQLSSNLECTLAVSRPHGRTKADIQSIGHFNGFIQRGILDNWQRWAKLLFCNQWVVVINVGDQGSRVEVAGLIIVRIPTGENPATAVFCILDQAIDNIDLLLPWQWAQDVFFFETNTHGHILALLDECLHDLVVNRLWNVQTLHGRTGLTSVDKRAPE